MRGLGRIKNAYQRVRRQFFPAAVILMYHRIIDQVVDPYGIVVSPGHFVQHLEYIRQTCHPIRLLDLIELESLPRRAVVISFDDGYTDFIHQAYPVLASAQVPATVFVTSGFVDSSANFWSDKLTRALLLTERVPPDLRLQIHGVEYQWTVTSPEERRLAHEAIYCILKSLTPAQQEDVLAYLANWAGVEPECADDRVMTSSELAQLARDGLVDVGAHTVNHLTLSAWPADAQRAEIVGCRQSLEAIVERPVLTFAYPYGTVQDWTDETVEIVEAAGFRAACTTTPGVVGLGSNPFRLRRCWVGDWDSETLRKNLEWYLLQ